MPDEREEGKSLWGLLRRIVEHPDVGVRIIGVFIAHKQQESGEAQVQLTFAEIGEASGLNDHPIRDRLDRLEEERMIRRERRRGRPGGASRVGETRGDYYSLAIGEDAAASVSTPPARAGPTNVRPEGVTSSPEPQGGLCSPDKEHEPSTTDQF